MNEQFMKDWGFNKKDKKPRVGDVVEYNSREPYTNTIAPAHGMIIDFQNGKIIIGFKEDNGEEKTSIIKAEDIIKSFRECDVFGDGRQ